MKSDFVSDKWRIPDDLWVEIAIHLPEHVNTHRFGGGRPRAPDRVCMDAIFFVLRTGCQWKALPKERFGSASAVHKRFLEWEKAGVFEALWKAGLAEYDQMEGIAWRWQSIDGAMFKAPMAQEAVGRNPTDRGKKGEQASPAGRRSWRPVVVHRDRSKRE